MGKETGFLELDRADRTYADPQERLHHYKEFVIPHAEPALKAQASDRRVGWPDVEQVPAAISHCLPMLHN